MLPIFYHLRRTVSRCYQGWNLIIQLMTVPLTAAFVWSGFDWMYFLSTRSTGLQRFLFPAAIIGGLVPILVPLLVLAIGHLRKNQYTIATAWAMGQSVMVAWCMSSFYKVFTGRLQPNLRDLGVDISHQFRFGFMRGGAFWGWPSTHTTIAFATAITLCVLYPKNRWLKAFVLIYAVYIGLGVSTSIHWFSEFAAGAMVGSVIGYQVGKSFLDRANRV